MSIATHSPLLNAMEFIPMGNKPMMAHGKASDYVMMAAILSAMSDALKDEENDFEKEQLEEQLVKLIAAFEELNYSPETFETKENSRWNCTAGLMCQYCQKASLGPFSSRLCLAVTYHPETKTVHIEVKAGSVCLHKNEAPVKKEITFTVTYLKIVKIWIDLYDILATPNTFSGCARISISIPFKKIKFDFGCFGRKSTQSSLRNLFAETRMENFETAGKNSKGVQYMNEEDFDGIDETNY